MRRNSKLFYCIAGVFVILCSLYSIGAFNAFIRKNVQKRAYDSGMEYSGELLDGRFSGKGTLCFQDGSMYVGGFKMGLFEGDAVYNSINGWSLSGIFENGRLVSGKLVTKDKKEMTIKDGKVMHKNENGWSYSGELNMLGQTGEGTFTYKDGSVYEGNFLVGLSNGLGKFTSADGKISCEGTFKKDVYPEKRNTTWGTSTIKDSLKMVAQMDKVNIIMAKVLVIKVHLRMESLMEMVFL